MIKMVTELNQDSIAASKSKKDDKDRMVREETMTSDRTTGAGEELDSDSKPRFLPSVEAARRAERSRTQKERTKKGMHRDPTMERVRICHWQFPCICLQCTEAEAILLFKGVCQRQLQGVGGHRLRLGYGTISGENSRRQRSFTANNWTSGQLGCESAVVVCQCDP